MKEVGFFHIYISVKSNQIISDHPSDGGIFSRSVCTSWVWMEMLSSEVRPRLIGYHARKSRVYFSKGFICIGSARQNPEVISGIEIYILYNGV